MRARDVTDAPSYEDMEYQRFERENLPGIIEIVELENERTPLIDDLNDPDYEPEESSARSRGDVVVRKRKVAKEKQERPRSKSRGRKTRSQSKNSEIAVD